ncbi:MAG: hypothetical protein ACREOJ_16740 [Gemmatimonadaceae bacterium]
MLRFRRILPWAFLLVLVMGIAFLAPRATPGWLPRVALALMGFGGAWNLVWAVVGYLTRQLAPIAAFGSFMIGVGFLLYGSQWLPGGTAGGTLSIAGLALGILGMLLQISAMKPAER